MAYTQNISSKKPYFLMLRGWMDAEYLKTPNEFSEREAYAYLMEEAAYKPRIREIDGMAISLQRGQLVGSFRFLAKAWGWKKDRVKRFLRKLERHGVVDMCSSYTVGHDSFTTVQSTAYNRRPTIVTLLHYNAIQRSELAREEPKEDRAPWEKETALRQSLDKPNQYQASTNKELKNQSVGAVSADRYLFEEFPQVGAPREFINYMPQEWQNYALHEKVWHVDEVLSEAALFWERYAGEDMADRQRKMHKFEKRTKWYHVWVKWCDQNFRNIHAS